MLMIQKAFTVGNSVVLTVPPKSGIEPGTKLKFRGRKKNKIEYEIVESDKSDVGILRDSGSIEEYLDRVTGAFDVPEGMSQKELMNRIKELEDNPYDPSIRFS
jgi:hypothetical protein